MNLLEKKIALVTGAGSGISQEIACLSGVFYGMRYPRRAAGGA